MITEKQVAELVEYVDCLMATADERGLDHQMTQALYKRFARFVASITLPTLDEQHRVQDPFELR